LDFIENAAEIAPSGHADCELSCANATCGMVLFL
jgi:hypothetical protein